MTRIAVQYVGGEKDGWREQLETDTHPDFLFIWRNSEDQRMSRTTGDARRILADKLGVLAYKFAGVRPWADGEEYIYVRWAQSDKKMTKL